MLFKITNSNFSILNNQKMSTEVLELTDKVTNLQAVAIVGVDPFIFGLTAFILACFVGYFVVWNVTPALHTPLMAVTNAVSGVIVVGAIIALGCIISSIQINIVSFLAVFLASINIFGGFVVTWRMLAMFKKK